MRNCITVSQRIFAVIFLSITYFLTGHQLLPILQACQTVLQDGMNSIPAAASNLNREYSENFYKKYWFINYNGLFRRLIRQVEMNHTIRLDNGHLVAPRAHVSVTNLGLTENMIRLNAFCREHEIPLLYVQAPYDISKYDSHLPAGVTDYSNSNADEFLSRLAEHNVDYLDLREEIHRDALDFYSMFLSTDNHWKPETGLWAAGKIISTLEGYGFSFPTKDFVDPSHYDIQSYPDVMLGSRGKRVGQYFSGHFDDLSLITPTFPTQMHLEVPSKNIIRDGDFLETQILKERITNAQNYWEENPYAAYTGSAYDRVIQLNENAPCARKLLFIRDSFGLTVQPFLSLGIREIHSLDLRYYHTQTLSAYIEEYQPDAVVFLYNPSMYDVAEMFKFGLE